MKKLLSVLVLTLSASFASAEVEPIRFAPTRPSATPTQAAPATDPSATPTKDAKSAKDPKPKKHTKAHHKKKAAAPQSH